MHLHRKVEKKKKKPPKLKTAPFHPRNLIADCLNLKTYDSNTPFKCTVFK